jgi:hypothetical protein
MITFVRRVRMLNGYFVEAMEILRERVEYIENAHGIKIELHSRFGGPVGEVAMVTRHDDATNLELFRKKISADVASDKLLKKLAAVTIPGETFDEIWMSQ